MALKKAVKKGKVTPLFTVEDICKMGDEYADITLQIKALEERKNILADKIKNGAEQFGVKDDKGSFYLERDNFLMGKVARKSFSIDQTKAVETLEAIGVGDVVDEVTIKSVNEDKLQMAVTEGRITLDTVEDFTDIKVSYSVLVKEKEALPEVEQSTLKVAKRK